MSDLYIGTAAWSVPPLTKMLFPGPGTHLQRYGQKLNGVEINSSFYKNHKFETYLRWKDSVPEDFRFSVKLLKYFTHIARLKESGSELKEVLESICGLSYKWGLLLVQLPPSLEFDLKTAEKFFSKLKKFCPVPVVIEPRHVTWLKPRALDLLSNYSISKVLADPEPCRAPFNRRPSLETIRYFRLHGSPIVYKSNYEEAVLRRLARRIDFPISPSKKTWVIFDNTTYGFATLNALHLTEIAKEHSHANSSISKPFFN